MKFPLTDIFEYYFAFYLLQSEEMEFDRIYRITLFCAMEKLRSRDVGVSLAVEETPTSPHSEDKNMSMNCKKINGH